MPFFSYPYIVTYDYRIIWMFAKIRTSIRIREWNAELSKYKTKTVRCHTKNAEYTHGSHGEAQYDGRLTRQRAAALFPDEDFGEQLSDEALLALLEEHDEVVEQEILDEKIFEQEDYLLLLEDNGFGVNDSNDTEINLNDPVIESNDHQMAHEPIHSQPKVLYIQAFHVEHTKLTFVLPHQSLAKNKI